MTWLEIATHLLAFSSGASVAVLVLCLLAQGRDHDSY